MPNRQQRRAEKRLNQNSRPADLPAACNVHYFVSFFCRFRGQPKGIKKLLGFKGRVTEEFGNGMFWSAEPINSPQSLQHMTTTIASHLPGVFDLKIINFVRLD